MATDYQLNRELDADFVQQARELADYNGKTMAEYLVLGHKRLYDEWRREFGKAFVTGKEFARPKLPELKETSGVSTRGGPGYLTICGGSKCHGATPADSGHMIAMMDFKPGDRLKVRGKVYVFVKQTDPDNKDSDFSFKELDYAIR